MKRRGFQITAITSGGPELERVAAREGVDTLSVGLTREIDPMRDWLALVQVARHLRRLRPDIVNAGTPKAGLLGMLAARLVGVPVRIYTVRGLRSETLTGARGWLVGMTERLASWCATDVLCVSFSLQDLYAERRYAPRAKLGVVGNGSSNGIEVDRFASSGERRRASRSSLGVGDDALVIGFVGRVVRDKGVHELVEAFDLLQRTHPDAVLVVVGEDEAEDAIDPAVRRRMLDDPRIVWTGHVTDPSEIYSAFDVFAFPSHREGLPNAVLEAGAAGLPCAGFAATGTRDVVVSGETGTLVPVGDVAALASAIRAYLDDGDLRAAHGAAAAQRVRTSYAREQVWSKLADVYDEALRRAGRGSGPA